MTAAASCPQCNGSGVDTSRLGPFDGHGLCRTCGGVGRVLATEPQPLPPELLTECVMLSNAFDTAVRAAPTDSATVTVELEQAAAVILLVNEMVRLDHARRAVQAQNHYLGRCSYCDAVHAFGADMQAHIAQCDKHPLAAATAELAALQERCADRFCEWRETEGTIWETQCGNSFQFSAGGPQEHRAKFCQYCGAHLVDVPYVHAGDIKELDCRDIL